MKQNNKLEFHIPLIISLAMLLAITIPTLPLPYCYSESQLLGDSILYLKEHGIGPIFCDNAVQLPDLFAFAYYGIIKYLTANPLYVHIISMAFALISIATAYNYGKFFFSVQAGVMGSAIMAAQNVFMAQSGLALPAMALNCCILGGVYLYQREKYFWCMVLMCAATLIDILGLVVSVFIIMSYFRIRFREWSMRKNMMLLLPMAIWFGYQMLSMYICGKLTIRTIDLSWMNFADNLYFIFGDQYRFVLSGILATIIIWKVVKKSSEYFVKDMAHSGAILLGLIYLTESLISSDAGWNLPAVSVLSVYAGCAIATVPTSYYCKYMIASAIIIASSISVLDRGHVTDGWVNYKSKIKVDYKTVKLVTENIGENDVIYGDKYFKKYLTLKELGYLGEYAIYKCDTTSATDHPYQWAIYSNFAPSEKLNSIQTDNNYEKRSTIYIGDCLNEIYQLKK